MNLTELELAQRIRDGTALSPMKFSNMWLVNLRITGTGLAYRSGLKEHVWRDPKHYLNDYFLQRCNGLLVIANHPEDAVLTEEDFTERTVGSVMLPYIRGDEVWAVCRIYVRDIVEQIVSGKVSTSPSVVFNNASGNVEVQDGDTNFLIEGVPFLLDHIALVTEDHGSLGVWDKEKIPTGVEVSNKTGDIDMDEKQLEAFQTMLAKAVGDAMGGVNQGIQQLTARMDSLEQGYKARADADDEAKRQADEKAKADEEEQKKADAAAEEQRKADEAEAQKKADEEKAKADEAAEEEKRKADAEEKERNDAAMSEAQAKADSAYNSLGKRAPEPFSGEKALDFRKRALIAMQKHSPQHANVNIRAIADSATLSVLEDAIYDAARKTITEEMNNTQGQLHKRVRNDEAGRRITEYVGDPNVWLSAFKTPARRVAKFNTQGSMNNV
ncbi:NUDIX hydrolase [Enterobacter asburiae]|uniref:NUDIX hydrolase n=1 Tax=Enterobacter asburiae TaxID=61645 RepID=A0ABU6KTW3_ENTAS|nr:NUDIX hydrolase [Enterobacter asburiae]MCK1017158.1 NUDIX hydrolase [Enterobacter asburiae]MDU2341980.1 NUDIX hydrolase [Enterobacter asburiae]MDU7759764.1 NUDIX hydrolase [Enterobacter asburiae]MEC5729326.1 NUDIX hydrolase [Enterobacter asburiae]MEC5861276.1 NUDIX hydrolase [Enterobacter asburiae]